METKQLNIVKALWWEEGTLFLLDQTKLPAEEVVLPIRDPEALIAAIQRLSVRGAPALGVAGAYGVLLASDDWKDSDRPPDWDDLANKVDPIARARPTAVNLKWGVSQVIRHAREAEPDTQSEAYSLLKQEAIALHRDDEDRCRKIGEYGAELLEDNARVITHCNAGALATGGIGTALGVIYSAVMTGKSVTVWANETRPLLQGARLTAWELSQAGVPVSVMTDDMGAMLMQNKDISAVIVGADRIANNGDTANKIGTYHLALAAKAHDIPFYVAAPTSTIDVEMRSGNDIPIEYRSKNEIVTWGRQEIAPRDVDVYAPAFDITPVKYITAIITDVGVLYPPYNFGLSLR